MKYFASFIFALAVAASTNCDPVPQYGIGSPYGFGPGYIGYSGLDLITPYDLEPSLGIGQVVIETSPYNLYISRYYPL